MQVFVVFSLITVLWCVYGYSLAFTEGNAFFGGFDRLFLKGTFDSVRASSRWRATFSQGRRRCPSSCSSRSRRRSRRSRCCLILGAFAERMKFSAVLLFIVLWFTFAYAPIAHMVWFWPGPDAYTAANVVDAQNAKAGYIWQMGALDFAGGTVVHINAGIAGLVGAYRDRQAHRLRQGSDGAAQPADDDDRRLAAVVRAGSGSTRAPRWKRTAPPRSRSSTRSSPPPARCCRGSFGRVDVQGQAVDAGCRVGRRRGPGRDHAGRGQRRHPRRVRDRPRRRRRLPVGRQRPEADARRSTTRSTCSACTRSAGSSARCSPASSSRPTWAARASWPTG